MQHRLRFFSLLFLLLTTYLNPPLQAQPGRYASNEAVRLSRLGQHDAAAVLFAAARDSTLAAEDWPAFIADSKNMIIGCGVQQPDLGDSIILQTTQLIEREAPELTLDLYELMSAQIYVRMTLVDYAGAERIFEQSLHHLQQFYPEEQDWRFVQLYQRYGMLREWQGRKIAANQHFLRALAILPNAIGPDDRDYYYFLSQLYLYTAGTYLEIGNVAESLHYADRYLRVQEIDHGQIPFNILAYHYQYLASLYQRLQETERAQGLFDRSIRVIREQPAAVREQYQSQILTSMIRKASLLVETTHPDAEAYLLTTADTLRKYAPEDVAQWVSLYTAMGDREWRAENYPVAIDWFQRADSLAATTDDASVFRKYHKLGTCYAANGEVDKALVQFQRGLSYYDPESSRYGYLLTPTSYARLLQEAGRSDSARHYSLLSMRRLGQSELTADDVPPPEDWYELDLTYKIAATRLQLLNAGESEADYRAALATARQADRYHTQNLRRVNTLRRSESTQLIRQSIPVYRAALQSAAGLYARSGDAAAKDQAFAWMQKLKAQDLWTTLLDTDATGVETIDSSLLATERNLAADINYAERQLRVAEIEGDSETAAYYRGEVLLDLRRRHRGALAEIETKHPRYYETKYDYQPTTRSMVAEVLQAGEVLVEYAMTDSLLYTFVVYPDGADTFFRQALDPQTPQRIRDYHALLTRSPLLRPKSRAQFVELSYQLYQQFLAPVKNQIAGADRLILIGDGLTNLIPFETLVTAPDNRPLAELPYLLRNYVISYHYSATLFARARQLPPNSAEGLYAFAPVYDYGTGARPAGSTRSPLPAAYTPAALGPDGAFAPLPESEAEVKAIAELFGDRAAVDLGPGPTKID